MGELLDWRNLLAVFGLAALLLARHLFRVTEKMLVECKRLTSEWETSEWEPEGSARAEPPREPEGSSDG
jgi:hypothetical protein